MLLFVLIIITSIYNNVESVSEFGPIILKDLYLESNYTNMNHGSYGVVPKSVLSSVTEAQVKVEMNPDQWFRYDVYNHLTNIREIVANYVKVRNSNDLVMVINASHGINAVLRSILELNNFRSKTLLYLSTAYGMVKHTIEYVAENFNIKTLQIPIMFPTTNDKIIETVENALKSKNMELGMCIFSHITSTPSIILPITRLTQLCKNYSNNAHVIIDGAHAPGQIDIEIGSFGEDAYIGNLHKWLYSPKGTAFLWVTKELQKIVKPTTISFEGKGESLFLKGFSYQGTDDYAPWIAVESALKWRHFICDGDDSKIIKYIHQLAVDGGNYLANAWNSELLVDEHMIGAMVNIIMPSSFVSSDDEAQQLTNALFTGKSKFMRTWVPIFRVNTNDESIVYVMRVSAQIYLNMDDFKRLANAVLDIVQQRYNKIE